MFCILAGQTFYCLIAFLHPVHKKEQRDWVVSPIGQGLFTIINDEIDYRGVILAAEFARQK